MKRPVRWSREALDDIREQIAFIAHVNPSAALRIADRLRKTGENLGEMATARPGRVAGIYERSVGHLPSIAAYGLKRIADRESVVVLRITHASRDWPDEGWPQQLASDCRVPK